MCLSCHWPNTITQKHSQMMMMPPLVWNSSQMEKTVYFKMFLSYTTMFINPTEDKKTCIVQEDELYQINLCTFQHFSSIRKILYRCFPYPFDSKSHMQEYFLNCQYGQISTTSSSMWIVNSTTKARRATKNHATSAIQIFVWVVMLHNYFINYFFILPFCLLAYPIL